MRLSDGEVTWTSPPTGDEYWSLLVQGDRILALANSGRLYLLRANPEEYEVLGEAEVAENSWAYLAASGSQLFVRDLNALVAYDWQ